MEMLKNTKDTFGLVALSLHWIVALVLIALFALGLWMVDLDYYDPWRKAAPEIHKAVGVLLFSILIARVIWRWISPPPQPLQSQPAWQRRAATTTHALLYLLPFALIGSGYLLSTADGRPVDVFGWFAIPATLHGIDGQEDIAGDVHFALAMTLIAVIVLHIAAAIHHHRVVGDNTLRRMLRPHRGHTALSGDER